MNFSLRAKLMGIILLAGTLLLIAGLGVIWTLGYRQRVTSQGRMFQSEAAHVTRQLDLIIAQNIQVLQALLAPDELAAEIDTHTAFSATPPAEVDALWTGLSADSPGLSALLGAPLSKRLRAFQKSNRLFVEILVADREGRLVAATNKTSDYFQGDESWWQQAMRLKEGEAVLEGLDFDQSSGVFSLDISLPIFADGMKEPAGVIKAVVNVSPMFAKVAVFSADSDAIGEVAGPRGRILLQMADEKFTPSGKTLPADVMRRLRPERPGWFIGRTNGGEERMIGFAPVHLLGIFTTEGDISGDPFYVVVSQSASLVLAPLRERATLLMLAGIVTMIVTAALGILLAQRNIIKPIETLRKAAAALAATAQGSARDLKPALAAVAQIKTADEMEDMADDFRAMAGKLLRYHEDLKREIANKTAEIQRDLELAREFQQAFLPRDYPAVPASGRGGLTLNFHHVYQAAMSVSGDFFDVIKLNDHGAGILIADVMGHGTRSALVTAILRTLLHSLARTAEDPGLFLSLLNRHFHETMRQTDQLIFVSACYVVFDTLKKEVRCASAGHPSPLVGNRTAGQIEPLYGPLKGNPALGLMAENEYAIFSRPLREGDVYILYTDGVVEAMNPAAEDFGFERLRQIMRDKLDQDIVNLTQGILASVRDFTDYEAPTDDLCLVAVEAVPVGSRHGDGGLRRDKLIEL